MCKLVVLELGIAILRENNDPMYFRQFENPLLSSINLKNKKYEEILETIEYFNDLPNLVLSNNQDVVELLKSRGIKSEKLSLEGERDIQINKLAIYKKCLDSMELSNSEITNEVNILASLRDFAIKWSSFRIQEASEQLDLHISQSVNALDELDKIINTVGTRVREWYGLHFPELDNLLQNVTTYSSIVSSAGHREEITKDLLDQLDIPENKIQIILDTAKRSRGGRITDENLTILKNLALQVISMNKIRKTLEEHIEMSMNDVAPNLKEMLTAVVGARLISKAGSLKKLASLSSSTIQILGAEKALFRTLKTGASPPKHGILFQHPVIHSAPKWQRGKLSRAISSKAAIAARIDLYAIESKSEYKLSDKLNKRIQEIQEKYKEPSINQQKQEQDFQKQGFKFKKSRKNVYGQGERKYGGRDRTNKFKKKFKKRHHKSNKKSNE